jgi:hypothetical protein
MLSEKTKCFLTQKTKLLKERKKILAKSKKIGKEIKYIKRREKPLI